MEILNKEMKLNFIESDSNAINNTTATAAQETATPVATLTSEMLTPEVVAQHMVNDKANLEGLTQQQGERIMTSFFNLFQHLSTQMMVKQQQQQPAPATPMPQQQPQHLQQQQRAEAEGMEQEGTVSEDEEESEDEAKMTLVVSRNEARKNRREKPAAAKGSGKGAAAPAGVGK